jgi:hypothetical protein
MRTISDLNFHRLVVYLLPIKPAAYVVGNVAILSTRQRHLREWNGLWRKVFMESRAVESHIDKERIMCQSRGALRFHPLFTAEDIGLRKDASVEHAIKVFLYVGEAIASRWVQMPKGVLLLQAVPDSPESGAIYLYDRERRIFYFVCFEQGRDDSLSVREFEHLTTEYDLLWFAANPDVLRGIVEPAMA